jgi:hypothetical protein
VIEFSFIPGLSVGIFFYPHSVLVPLFVYLVYVLIVLGYTVNAYQHEKDDPKLYFYHTNFVVCFRFTKI